MLDKRRRFLHAGSLKKVINEFEEDSKLQLLYGDYIVVDENQNMEAKPKISFDFDICLFAYLMIPQPSSFWKKSLYESVSGINTDLNFAFDWDLFLRMGHQLRDHPGSIRHRHDLYSVFRIHPESKSVSQTNKFKSEARFIRDQFQEYRESKFKKIQKRWQLVKALHRFHKERNMIPTGKDKRKA